LSHQPWWRGALAVAASAVALLAASNVVAETRRLAVIVGSNLGSGARPTLQFAETDAERVADVLFDLGGVHAGDLWLLKNASLGTVRRSFEEATRRITESHSKSGTRAVLLFYFSGHSDGESLELGTERITFRDLRTWLGGTGADVRLAIIDSCKSGALIAAKGGALGPAYDIRLSDDLTSTGDVVITSSASDENALESKEIRGSFFSHHLLSGLRGAADASGDGQVTLAEAYRYAYAHTLTATASTFAGAQHPAYDFRLSGQGELVMTSLSNPSAVIELPAGFERQLVADLGRDQVVGEITSGAVTRFAVRPGTYAVRCWAGGKAFATKIEIRRGETRTIGREQLLAFEVPTVRDKGGMPGDQDLAELATALSPPRSRPTVFVGGGAERAVARQLSFLESVRIAFQSPRPRWLSLSLTAATGASANFRESRFALGLGGRRGWERGGLRIQAGIEVGGGIVAQSIESAALQWSSFATASSVAGLAAKLGRGIRLGLEGQLGGALLRQDGNIVARFAPAMWLGLNIAL